MVNGPDPNQMQNLDELVSIVDEAKHRPGDGAHGGAGWDDGGQR